MTKQLWRMAKRLAARANGANVGRATTEAKRLAARVNGAKGGRSQKVVHGSSGHAAC